MSSAIKRLVVLKPQLRPLHTTSSSALSNMKEAIVSAGPSVKIVDSPIPKPGSDQVVTKVVFSGSNPKDWKVPGTRRLPCNMTG